jgi:hypothetical protein
MTRLPITGIVLNWRRPENVRAIVATLSPIVEEMIVWNNNPAELFLDSSAKTINCSSDFGLYTRFIAALLAQNDTIWMQDDDLLAPLDTVRAVYESWQRRPDNVHGLFGRKPGEDCQYNFVNATGECPIVLTRGCMFHRQLAIDFFRVAGDPRILAVRELCVEMGCIEHNGEDILLSYVARIKNGKTNVAHDLPVTELPEGADRISASPAHMNARTAMVRACEAIFAERETGVIS